MLQSHFSWILNDDQILKLYFFSETLKKRSQKKSATIGKRVKSKSNKEDKDISKLDDNAKEVAIKFKAGCECHEQNCFQGKHSHLQGSSGISLVFIGQTVQLNH